MALQVERMANWKGINYLNHGKGSVHKHVFEKSIGLHLGSGEFLEEFISFCEENKVPLIQGSSGMKVPTDRNLVIVNAPNLSLTIMKLLSALPVFTDAFKSGMKISLVESHQKSKGENISGTALAIAQSLDLPESAITMVRDPGIQRLIGVPEEYLDGHAKHNLIFRGEYGVRVSIEIEVDGRETYAEGAIVLAEALANLSEPLKNGVYELKDILHILPK